MRTTNILVLFCFILGFANLMPQASAENNSYIETIILQGELVQRDSTPPAKTTPKPPDCLTILREKGNQVRDLRSKHEKAIKAKMSRGQLVLYKENQDKKLQIRNAKSNIEQLQRKLGQAVADPPNPRDESCEQKLAKSKKRIKELQAGIKQPQMPAKKELEAKNKGLRTELASLHNQRTSLEKQLQDKRAEAKKKRIAANAKKALDAPTQIIDEVASDNGSTVATRISFGGMEFDVYSVDPKKHRVDINWKDDKGQIIRSLNNMKTVTGIQGKELLFATNGGMYTPSSHAQGLLIIDGKTHQKIEKKEDGYGNFFLQPNGVFYIDTTGIGHVTTTKQYMASKVKPRHATQSGPMLVVDGKYHPVLTPGSENLHIRSGVGITKDGRIVFAISNKRVNFYTFARLFKDYYKCDNALYLDGAISLMYLKDLKRLDKGGRFGPIISVAQNQPKTAPQSTTPNKGKK